MSVRGPTRHAAPPAPPRPRRAIPSHHAAPRALPCAVWNNVYGFNMRVIRDLAMLEPLVDTVQQEAVITDHCTLWTCDIQTVKKSDLTFECPWRISARRNDFMHAVVVYFDIEFSHCHKPIKFSTGPQAKYTHWKQTVFYLQEPLTAEVGEVVEGVLRCRPNARNHRDLDIELEYKMEGRVSQVRVAQAYRLR